MSNPDPQSDEEIRRRIEEDDQVPETTLPRAQAGYGPQHPTPAEDRGPPDEDLTSDHG